MLHDIAEARRVGVAALAFFFLLAAYYVIRPVRDQLAGATGSVALPWFYAGTFVAMLVVAPVFGWLSARLPRRALLGWGQGFFIACLVAFVPLFAQQASIGARALGIGFFIWVSVFNLFVVSLFWSLMADLFDGERARRVFPLIALGGAFGALAGPALTSLLVERIGVAPLLAVSAMLLVIALGLMLYLSATNAGTRAESAPIGGSMLAGLRATFADPFLRLMALLMLCSDGVGTLAYALVADYAKAHFADAVARTAFYGHIDLAVNILQMVLQVGLTRWMLPRFGIVSGLVLPAMVNMAVLVAVALFGTAQFGVAGITIVLVPLMLIVTRGFAYGLRGLPVPGTDVRVELDAPDGSTWTWGSDDAADRVSGPALDFCLVVTQRRHVADTAVKADGALAQEWLGIAQAFAGSPGAGRQPGQFAS